MRALALLLLGLTAAPAAAQRVAPLIQVRETDPAQAGPLAQEAFHAAYGRRGEAPVVHGGRTYDFSPVTAVKFGNGRVALFSTGALRGAGHPEEGLNAVHYLARVGSRLRVAGHWLGLGAGGSHGMSATSWGETRALSRWLMLYTEGGGTWQDCTVRFATLTELRPTGPVDVADFPVGFDDRGMVEGPQAREIDGAIVTAVPDRSFTVRYSGTMTFSETYVRTGDRYRLGGRRQSRMPGC